MVYRCNRIHMSPEEKISCLLGSWVDVSYLNWVHQCWGFSSSQGQVPSVWSVAVTSQTPTALSHLVGLPPAFSHVVPWMQCLWLCCQQGRESLGLCLPNTSDTHSHADTSQKRSKFSKNSTEQREVKLVLWRARFRLLPDRSQGTGSQHWQERG